MGKDKEPKKRSDRVEDEPNYIEYKRLLEAGEFDNLDPKSYLAFNNEKLVAKAATREEIFETLHANNLEGGTMITQVDPEPIQLDGFFVDPDGNLRRGIPTWVHDKKGKEVPVNLEWGSDKVYPREESPKIDEN